MEIKKKKPLTYLVVPLPIYRVSVVIFFGVSLEGMIKEGIERGINPDRFTREWKKWPEDQIASTTQGFTMNYGEKNDDVLVWVRERPKKLSGYATLYHELYHAVDHIADSRSFDPSDKISEPKAYLFEYLFTEVSKVLWKK